MRCRPVTLVVTALAVTAVTVTASPVGAPRLIWNVSASVPTGLYAVRPVHELVVDMLVVTYPPEPLASWLADGGYLPRRVPLLKPVAALPGQVVCRAGRVITVDGRDIGMALEQDHAGRPLPAWTGCRVIGAGEVFLMNRDAPASLDGRYFGVMPIAAIAGRAEPVWTSREGS